jgi:hypothetical protein
VALISVCSADCVSLGLLWYSVSTPPFPKCISLPTSQCYFANIPISCLHPGQKSLMSFTKFDDLHSRISYVTDITTSRQKTSLYEDCINSVSVLDILYTNYSFLGVLNIFLLHSAIGRDIRQYKMQEYEKIEGGMHHNDSRDVSQFKDTRTHARTHTQNQVHCDSRISRSLLTNTSSYTANLTTLHRSHLFVFVYV